MLHRLKTNIKKIVPSRQIELFEMIIGLIVDVITLLSFIRVISIPPDSANFYINSQEFLVWSLIAAVYGLGFVNAKIIRRWRKLYKERKQSNTGRFFTRFDLDAQMFNRHLALSIITTFPLTFLFIHAAMVAGTNGAASPWAALFLAAFLEFFVALGMLVVAYGFDMALSLYSGEGDVKEEILDR